MKPLILLLLAPTLAACEIFTGPKECDCRWRYTKTEIRTDTIWNTAGSGFILVTHEVPTDSVLECRLRDSG